MTLQTIAPLLKQGRATKRGRKAQAKPVLFSRKTEIYYTRELLAISAMCQHEGMAALKLIENAGLFIGDSAIGDAPWWVTKVASAFTGLGDKVKRVSDKIAGKVVNDQSNATDKQLADQIVKMSGIDIRGIMKAEQLSKTVDEAINANVALIQSIPTQYHSRLEQIILNGFQEGRAYKWIKDEVKALGQSTDKRARLIASDQIGKLNGRFNQVRQQGLGITHYFWSTSHDERVRKRHKNWDGDRIAWDSPTIDGHPGQAIRCRCTPIPDLDDLLN